MKKTICTICLLAMCLAPTLSFAGASLNISVSKYEVAGFTGRIFEGRYLKSHTYNINSTGAQALTVQLADPGEGGDVYRLNVSQLSILIQAGTKLGQIQYHEIGGSNYGNCNQRIRPVNGRIDMVLTIAGYSMNYLKCMVKTGELLGN